MKNLLTFILLFALTVATFPSSGRGETSNTFVITDNLNTARYGHTATLLNSGKVLVAGGVNGSLLNSAELYDPLNKTWSPTGSMVYKRAYHTATLLPDGRVLVVGATASDNSMLAVTEIYDPLTGKWTLAGNLLVPRMGHSSTLLQSGKVLIAGGVPATGQVTDSAEIFDPITNQFTLTGNLNTARRSHSAVGLQNGKVLISGGGTNSSIFTSAEIYDPISGTWSMTGSLQKPNDAHKNSTVLLTDGRVLVTAGGDGGGSLSLSSAELYEPDNNAFRFTGSLAHDRKYFHAVKLDNGTVLAVGGKVGSGSFIDAAEIYDPSTETWQTTAPLNAPRYEHTVTTLSSGNVLVTGGIGSSGVLNSTEIFKIYAEPEPIPESDPKIEVTIDITPDGNPNTIKLGSKGTIPVAVLSSSDFDANTIDPTTAIFAGSPVKIKNNSESMAALEDVNNDGLQDLVMHFERELLNITPEDTEATFEAKSIDGQLKIFGKGPVRIIP